MSKKFSGRLYVQKLIIVFTLIVVFFTPNLMTVNAQESVYLGGYAMGFTINQKGCEVLGLSEIVTDNGIKAPAADAGITEHDVILNVGGKETNSFNDLDNVLSNYSSGTLIISVKRGEEVFIKEITPVKDLSGKYKLGLYVRDKLSGIGTLTFVTKNKNFVALGHPICGENNNIIEIKTGELFACNVYGIEKGERGKAGELRGVFYSESKIGVINTNTDVGIKGRINDGYDIKGLNEIQTGEGHQGSATLITTVDGIIPREFSISIVKVDKHSKDNRNFVIKVTDKNLLDIAGGIVQGMSGSPIVQDGKLVGAITHVFLNDPTRGFGIAIENMM